jgi:serine/threonine-protein kinase
LLPHLAADSSYVERFRLEAQAAAALVHANIVQVHEVGNVDGVHYIAQEYVAGENLKDLMLREGRLGPGRTVRILAQVAAALAKAASQGIIHRDIKPENILLATTGEVKVADFGLARVASDSPLNLTQVGVTLGTPLYMSPEQAEGKTLDPRSDLYSLGVTAYHMLTGRPPFEGETALAVAVQHLKAEPEPVEKVRDDLPRPLCAVVMRMLAKDPQARFASGRELLRELNHLQIDAADDLDATTPDNQERMRAIHAATEQLQTALVKREAAGLRARGWRRSYLIAGVLALLVGLALGWLLRDPFLLAGANPKRTRVARQDNEIDQLLYASRLNSEEGWLSVAEYFPQSPFYINLAQQQLARLYLQRGDLDRAQPIFARFAAMDEAEQSFRAFGLAGLCVVYSLESDFAHSSEALSELHGLRRYLDPQMSQLVELAVRRNREGLSPKTREDWLEFFETHSAGEEPGQS